VAVVLGIIGFILWVAVIIAIFEIRTSTQKTVQKLDEIQDLLRRRLPPPS